MGISPAASLVSVVKSPKLNKINALWPADSRPFSSIKSDVSKQMYSPNNQFILRPQMHHISGRYSTGRKRRRLTRLFVFAMIGWPIDPQSSLNCLREPRSLQTPQSARVHVHGSVSCPDRGTKRRDVPQFQRGTVATS